MRCRRGSGSGRSRLYSAISAMTTSATTTSRTTMTQTIARDPTCGAPAASTGLCSIARRGDPLSRLSDQRDSGQEPPAAPSRFRRARPRRRAGGQAVPARRRRAPALQRQARHVARSDVGDLGPGVAAPLDDVAFRRVARGGGDAVAGRAGGGVREAGSRARDRRPLGGRALRPRRTLTDARRAGRRRVGDGLPARDARLALVGRRHRRRRQAVPDAARAGRAGGVRRGGVAKPARPGGGGDAPRR